MEHVFGISVQKGGSSVRLSVRQSDGQWEEAVLPLVVLVCHAL